jgi:hypothetical protein
MDISPDALRKAREENANIAYQTFIKHIDENKDGLFCFFEGKDAPYYGLRIKIFAKRSSYFSLPCKGKKMVLKVHELISRHQVYDKYIKAFFIDRDFDSKLAASDPNIYETPTYSIENLYVTKNCVSEIFKHEFGLSEVDDDYKKALAIYNERLREFCQAMCLFNAWYATLKDRKNNENVETGVSLDAKPPKGYIYLSLDQVKCGYDIERIQGDFKGATTFDQVALTKKLEEFQNADMVNLFRGKYLMYFLISFLNLLITDSNTEKKYINRKLSYNTDANIAMSAFSQYAETPETLEEFLKRYAIAA